MPPRTIENTPRFDSSSFDKAFDAVVVREAGRSQSQNPLHRQTSLGPNVALWSLEPFRVQVRTHSPRTPFPANLRDVDILATSNL